MLVLRSEGWVHVNQAKGEQEESTCVNQPHNRSTAHILSWVGWERKASGEESGGLSLFKSILVCFLSAQFLSFPPLVKARECSKSPEEKNALENTWENILHVTSKQSWDLQPPSPTLTSSWLKEPNKNLNFKGLAALLSYSQPMTQLLSPKFEICFLVKL